MPIVPFTLRDVRVIDHLSAPWEKKVISIEGYVGPRSVSGDEYTLVMNSPRSCSKLPDYVEKLSQPR